MIRALAAALCALTLAVGGAHSHDDQPTLVLDATDPSTAAVAPAGTGIVPDLVGRSVAEARAAVEAVGLELIVLAEPGTDDVSVRVQDPPPGVALELGGTVTATEVG